VLSTARHGTQHMRWMTMNAPSPTFASQKFCHLCYRMKLALAGTATQRSWRQRAMTTRLSYVNPFPHCVFITLMSGPSASPPQCKGERAKHVRLSLLSQLLCASTHNSACSASHLVVIFLLLYIVVMLPAAMAARHSSPRHEWVTSAAGACCWSMAPTNEYCASKRLSPHARACLR
jgi:hypothetical protein